MAPLVDPNPDTWAKLGSTLRDWPLWLLSGAAASVTVFVIVPVFSHLVNSKTLGALQFATIALWILTATRATVAVAHALHSRDERRQARVKFFLTPVDGQCAWGISKQKDGTWLTQLSGHFMVSNRTLHPLYLTGARIKSPTIKGEVLPSVVTLESRFNKMHGTAHVSRHFVPPNDAFPGSIVVMVKGTPRQAGGTLKATLEVSDANGHSERVRAHFRYIGPTPAEQ